MKTDETENGNGKLKRKTEMESGNRKAEIWKWSSEIQQACIRTVCTQVYSSVCEKTLAEEHTA